MAASRPSPGSRSAATLGIYSRVSHVEELDPVALDRETRGLSRFRACRYTEVSTKKFKYRPLWRSFSGGHWLMPHLHHVEAAASRSRSLLRDDGGSIGLTTSRTRLPDVASPIRRRRGSMARLSPSFEPERCFATMEKRRRLPLSLALICMTLRAIWSATCKAGA
jgi:hypothetical protein